MPFPKYHKRFFSVLTPVLCVIMVGTSQAQTSRSDAPAPIVSQRPSTLSPVAQPSWLAQQGNQVAVNGRVALAAWSQQQRDGNLRTGISDAGLMQVLGLDLLNTTNANQQPAQWFSEPLNLSTWLTQQYRYLDIGPLVQQMGWQVQVNGNTLLINTPPAQVTSIRQGRQSWGDRIVVNLDRPSFWQMEQQGAGVVVTLDASPTPEILNQFKPTPANGILSALQTRPTLRVESAANRTLLRIGLPNNLRPQVTTLINPPRLVIDLRPDALVERDILWTNGMRWRQQWVSVGNARFPVTWLAIDSRQPGITVKPIWSNPTSLVGIAALGQMAQTWQAAAAINAGFFNRNTQMPLGAIRQDNQWLSSPILNRGAIAWNEVGRVTVGRLTQQETLVTSSGQRLPIASLNSGYVQAGIARYTTAWGVTYSPMTDYETLVLVRNNQVVTQQAIGKKVPNSPPVVIPADGYVLILRSNQSALSNLAIGTTLQLENRITPDSFAAYSQAIGAGPLLIQGGQIVLDAEAEKFSKAFRQEKAPRSAIGMTAEGTLLIVAVHDRVNGASPSLSEMAQLMRQLGAVDALNLDGGSSTSLYLGGQLLNRSPRTAARVHNGIGIFITPRP